VNIYALSLLVSWNALQAPTATLRVEVRAAQAPVAAADVVIAGRTYRTAADGTVSIAVPPGTVEVTVVKDDFLPVTTSVTVQAAQVQVVQVELQHQPTVAEVVTVSATRTDKRLEDQPMRVEVLAKEDLEEEQTQTPGDIVMVLNEKAGLRVQATSPALGTASIRIQGMRGRYTRILSDGLPLFGEDVGGLGLLQTPPADLGHIEVIKGVASALYGAGALGGVIDLISRRPDATPVRQALVNRSSRGATDTVLFATQPLSDRWSGSLLVGGHWQQQTDVDGDGWADLPGYARAVVRPRVFWDDTHGDSLFATLGVTWERRTGGTVANAVLPTTGAPDVEALQTSRVDGGFVAQTLVADHYLVTARGSATSQQQDHQFGPTRELDHNATLFGEMSVRGQAPHQTWVGGVAVERDSFTPDGLPQFGYTYHVPAIFAQDDVDLGRWLSVSASGRVDAHDRVGTFVSPRASALVRGASWNSRVSVGTGFFAPTPLTDETASAGLTRLTIPVPLTVERGQSASWDVTRTIGPASITATLFHSRIDDPVVLDRQRYVLANVTEPTTNTGAELLATIGHEPFSLTTTYTYVRALEGAGADRGEVPLTPRHSVGVFGVWEEEEFGRVALEWYYTGRQRLEDNPYRTESVPYILFGGLVERRFHRVRLFLNVENLGNVRQTQFDPLIRPSPAVDGRWTVDAWAPLDGRVINGGIRVMF
jgi:outer membrane receptor for ferrienterochelin and colicins